jgi:hypothetical protein
MFIDDIFGHFRMVAVILSLSARKFTVCWIRWTLVEIRSYFRNVHDTVLWCIRSAYVVTHVLEFPDLLLAWSGCMSGHEYLLYYPFKDWVRVRVTLRLDVYRQSVRLGAKPLEAHAWSLSISQLNSYGHNPCVTSSMTRRWVCLLWICLAFVKCTYRTYSMLLKILPFTIYTSSLSVQALQCRSCLSYLAYATTAA